MIFKSRTDRQKQRNAQSKLIQLAKNQSVLELDREGKITDVNEHFLSLMGYIYQELINKPFSSLIRNAQSFGHNDLPEECPLITKKNKIIWFKLEKITLPATTINKIHQLVILTDITKYKMQNAILRSHIHAIDKSHAVIEFDLNGTIKDANDNFLSIMGYDLQDIIGQHHSIFVEPQEAKSEQYHTFWETLKEGKFTSGEFKRFDKSGKELWIYATYNPIFDSNQKPYKVIKYASDITAEKLKAVDNKGQLQAINKSQAVIEFNMDGTIISANDNFINTMGYSLEEILGHHHSLFTSSEYAQSDEYRRFWIELNQGMFKTGEYKRQGKDGKEIWIQASYNPIFGLDGRPFKIVKYASDITHQKQQSANHLGQIQAINKSQAVIEFNMDGTIITANDNFLKTTGYSLDEIKGQHHSIFTEPEYAQSNQYKMFWQQLRKGEFHSGEYKRRGKNNREIWIQATYNPILDADKKPIKVVKFASDITTQKLMSADYQGQLNAISKSQAVIEFNMDGTIRSANENFLATTKYQLSEIQGKHHRIFAEPSYANSEEYTQFWQKLNQGKFDQGEYKRLTKYGDEVWIQASYNPIFDSEGKPFKIVKYATDITARKMAIKCIKSAILSLAKGDLSHEIDIDLGPEFNILKEAMNGLTSKLHTMVHDIDKTAQGVFDGSQSIVNDSEELSKRIERQAASLEETAATMEALSSTVQQNAHSAEKVSTHTDLAMQKAVQGGETVSNAVSAMSDIEQCSNRISDIIGVINDIAFQTNLLALNASVEAARAGEAGRGFAVVASEVRNLAQRSASAAKEIKALITDSSAAVAKGSNLVAISGERFEELTSVVQEVNDMITNIAQAEHEQAEGVSAISATVAQLDSLTQRNMQLLKKSNQAGRVMKDQADNLLQQISTFKTIDRQELLPAPETHKIFQLPNGGV